MSTVDPFAASQTLVRSLAQSLDAQVIETHISWVLLAGDQAWKIKKPVRLAFVDYSTLEARRHFCEEELRLNRRLAPSTYLGLARITGTIEAPSLDGDAPLLEYAVHMRRFDQHDLFSERVAAGTLAASDVDALADLLARYHTESERAGEGFAQPERRRKAALAALRGASAIATTGEQAALEQWLHTEADALTALWQSRLAQGHVRQCHGDLHLDNIIIQGNEVAAFDCLEFDPALYCIDVIDDLAFPVMDFCARGRKDFAFRLLNGWLDRTGDHDGLPALRFAVVYRALVRSQVARLREGDQSQVARRYLDTALAWTAPGQPRLSITHGLPGSGKTFQSQRRLEAEGAIRLRSDVERKRLFGLGMLDDSHAKGLDLYDSATTRRTYERIYAVARLALRAGYPVILDAAFLMRAERMQARAVAQELGVPFGIIDCRAPPQVLRERLLARRGDASEADVAVLEKLSVAAQPLGEDERALVLRD